MCVCGFFWCVSIVDAFLLTRCTSRKILYFLFKINLFRWLYFYIASYRAKIYTLKAILLAVRYIYVVVVAAWWASLKRALCNLPFQTRFIPMLPLSLSHSCPTRVISGNRTAPINPLLIAPLLLLCVRNVLLHCSPCINSWTWFKFFWCKRLFVYYFSKLYNNYQTRNFMSI